MTSFHGVHVFRGLFAVDTKVVVEAHCIGGHNGVGLVLEIRHGMSLVLALVILIQFKHL